MNTVLRLPAVLAATGLSRSTLYSEVAAGRFPPQVRLSKRCVGWHSSDVSHWLTGRILERGQKAGLPLP